MSDAGDRARSDRALAAATRRAANRVLDLEAQGESRRARDLVNEARRADPEFEGVMRELRGVDALLSRGLATPDFVPSVLEEVDRRRAFLVGPERRRISASRVAVAAAGLLAFGGMVYFQRVSPPAPEGPVGELIDASRADLSRSWLDLSSAMGELQRGVVEPVGAMVRRRPAPRLTADDAARYDLRPMGGGSRVVFGLVQGTIPEEALGREAASSAEVADGGARPDLGPTVGARQGDSAVWTRSPHVRLVGESRAAPRCPESPR